VTAPRLVLASASPRRRELLARLVAGFDVRASEADETPLPGETPEAMVLRLALVKARAVARLGEVALGADTVVAVDGEILGKPADDADALAMLRRLSGRGHEVWTGVALVAAGDGPAPARELARACRTGVVFRTLSEGEMAAYVATGEPHDKAGAYGIQGGAAAFVDHVDGDFTNVVGLPLPLVAELLAELETETADSPVQDRKT
jgi:septum formation protein